ncbi:EF_hand domain-containing protein [Hexamita inflata]|uniref:EF hand domain-containing protein n=1 Tax=Hexamita inflata TaxID=28002 RepID=A0AA86NU29_9EUKA|nr:EF hand domain-containing protein [Hexamita inflata]CAI9968246.1 EF hand domain-containing protein [Hexamita inflata]
MGKLDFKQIKQIFNVIDGDHSGKIDKKELANALSTLQLNIDTDTIHNILNLIDQDNDEQMNYDEFCVFINVCDNADPELPASVLFYAADLDFSGSINRSELSKILKKLDINIDLQQLQMVMNEAADNKDRTISYSMFIKLIEEMSV